MAEKKKKAKPFKTAAGAQQFMRNFDLENIAVSTQAEIDRILLINSLEETKPNKTAQTFSKCVGLELDKPKVSL